MKQRLFRFFAGSLAFVFFLTNAALAHAAESNLWAERRGRLRQSRADTGDAPRLAGLPAAAPELLLGLPALDRVSKSSTLSQSVLEKLPKGFSERHAPLLAALSTPYGSVRGVSFPANPSASLVVIHIQDVHRNEGAQKNIGQAVQALVEKNQADLVALEGAFEPIDLSGLRDFSRGDILRKVADFLLRIHKISGPIHAALTAPRAFPAIVGIDDASHHRANVAAYRRAAPVQGEYGKALSREASLLAREKEKAFTPGLLVLDRAVQSYREGKSSLGDYVQTLAGSGPTAGQVNLFLQVLAMERSLDFGRVESERTELLKALVREMDKDQSDALLQWSAAYRLGQARYADFYGALRELCGKCGVPLARFPSMDAYIRYVLSADRIDGDALLADVSALEKGAYARLAKTPAEKRLLEQSRALFLTGKLVDFSLTPGEWDEYAALPAGERPFGRMDLSSFESFYQEARSRDQAMTDNLLGAMSGNKTKTAVLVTGGYHSPGMDEKLRRAGVTVISFTPKIEKIDTAQGSSYLSVFTQEKAPLEKLFQGQKLFLAEAPADGTSLIPPYSSALAVAEAWRTGKRARELRATGRKVIDEFVEAFCRRVSPEQAAKIRWRSKSVEYGQPEVSPAGSGELSVRIPVAEGKEHVEYTVPCDRDLNILGDGIRSVEKASLQDRALFLLLVPARWIALAALKIGVSAPRAEKFLFYFLPVMAPVHKAWLLRRHAHDIKTLDDLVEKALGLEVLVSLTRMVREVTGSRLTAARAGETAHAAHNPLLSPLSMDRGRGTPRIAPASVFIFLLTAAGFFLSYYLPSSYGTAGALLGAATFGMGGIVLLAQFLFAPALRRGSDAGFFGKVLTAALGVSLLILAGFHHYGAKINGEWVRSFSRRNVVEVLNARQDINETALAEIASQAEERHRRIEGLLEDAAKSKSKTVANRTKDSIDRARRLMAYDEFSKAVAMLNLNMISKDPAKRLGGILPAEWKRQLEELEAAARASGFEGDLARRLMAFETELMSQHARHAALEKALKGYKAQLPGLFAGEMGGRLDAAQKDLLTFQQTEEAAEESLHEAKNQAMRSRVSDKLYARPDGVYKGHRDHFDALADLFRSHLHPAADRARRVYDDLEEVVAQREAETENQTLAILHSHDPETVTDTDSKGNTTTRTVYVDNSGPYRAAAAAAAEAAQEAARRANAEIKSLGEDIRNLRGNAQLQAENLAGGLPDTAKEGVEEGHGGFVGYFPLAGLLSRLTSSEGGKEARDRFMNNVLSRIERVEGEIHSRADQEDDWLGTKIDEDLRAQMASRPDAAAAPQPRSKSLPFLGPLIVIPAISFFSGKVKADTLYGAPLSTGGSWGFLLVGVAIAVGLGLFLLKRRLAREEFPAPLRLRRATGVFTLFLALAGVLPWSNSWAGPRSGGSFSSRAGFNTSRSAASPSRAAPIGAPAPRSAAPPSSKSVGHFGGWVGGSQNAAPPVREPSRTSSPSKPASSPARTGSRAPRAEPTISPRSTSGGVIVEHHRDYWLQPPVQAARHGAAAQEGWGEPASNDSGSGNIWVILGVIGVALAGGFIIFRIWAVARNLFTLALIVSGLSVESFARAAADASPAAAPLLSGFGLGFAIILGLSVFLRFFIVRRKGPILPALDGGPLRFPGLGAWPSLFMMAKYRGGKARSGSGRGRSSSAPGPRKTPRRGVLALLLGAAGTTAGWLWLARRKAPFHPAPESVPPAPAPPKAPEEPGILPEPFLQEPLSDEQVLREMRELFKDLKESWSRIDVQGVKNQEDIRRKMVRWASRPFSVLDQMAESMRPAPPGVPLAGVRPVGGRLIADPRTQYPKIEFAFNTAYFGSLLRMARTQPKLKVFAMAMVQAVVVKELGTWEYWERHPQSISLLEHLKRRLARALRRHGWAQGRTALPPEIFRTDRKFAEIIKFLNGYWAGGSEASGYVDMVHYWLRFHPGLAPEMVVALAKQSLLYGVLSGPVANLVAGWGEELALVLKGQGDDLRLAALRHIHKTNAGDRRSVLPIDDPLFIFRLAHKVELAEGRAGTDMNAGISDVFDPATKLPRSAHLDYMLYLADPGYTAPSSEERVNDFINNQPMSGGGSMRKGLAWQENARWETPVTFLGGAAASLIGWILIPEGFNLLTALKDGNAASLAAFALFVLGWAAMPLLFKAGHLQWRWRGRILWEGNPEVLKGFDAPRLLKAKWILAIAGMYLSSIGLAPGWVLAILLVPLIIVTAWHGEIQERALGETRPEEMAFDRMFAGLGRLFIARWAPAILFGAFILAGLPFHTPYASLGGIAGLLTVLSRPEGMTYPQWLASLKRTLPGHVRSLSFLGLLKGAAGLEAAFTGVRSLVRSPRRMTALTALAASAGPAGGCVQPPAPTSPVKEAVTFFGDVGTFLRTFGPNRKHSLWVDGREILTYDLYPGDQADYRFDDSNINALQRLFTNLPRHLTTGVEEVYPVPPDPEHPEYAGARDGSRLYIVFPYDPLIASADGTPIVENGERLNPYIRWVGTHEIDHLNRFTYLSHWNALLARFRVYTKQMSSLTVRDYGTTNLEEFRSVLSETYTAGVNEYFTAALDEARSRGDTVVPEALLLFSEAFLLGDPGNLVWRVYDRSQDGSVHARNLPVVVKTINGERWITTGLMDLRLDEKGRVNRISLVKYGSSERVALDLPSPLDSPFVQRVLGMGETGRESRPVPEISSDPLGPEVDGWSLSFRPSDTDPVANLLEVRQNGTVVRTVAMGPFEELLDGEVYSNGWGRIIVRSPAGMETRQFHLMTGDPVGSMPVVRRDVSPDGSWSIEFRGGSMNVLQGGMARGSWSINPSAVSKVEFLPDGARARLTIGSENSWDFAQWMVSKSGGRQVAADTSGAWSVLSRSNPGTPEAVVLEVWNERGMVREIRPEPGSSLRQPSLVPGTRWLEVPIFRLGAFQLSLVNLDSGEILSIGTFSDNYYGTPRVTSVDIGGTEVELTISDENGDSVSWVIPRTGNPDAGKFVRYESPDKGWAVEIPAGAVNVIDGSGAKASWTLSPSDSVDAVEFLPDGQRARLQVAVGGIRAVWIISRSGGRTLSDVPAGAWSVLSRPDPAAPGATLFEVWSSDKKAGEISLQPGYEIGTPHPVNASRYGQVAVSRSGVYEILLINQDSGEWLSLGTFNSPDTVDSIDEQGDLVKAAMTTSSPRTIHKTTGTVDVWSSVDGALGLAMVVSAPGSVDSVLHLVRNGVVGDPLPLESGEIILSVYGYPGGSAVKAVTRIGDKTFARIISPGVEMTPARALLREAYNPVGAVGDWGLAFEWADRNDPSLTLFEVRSRNGNLIASTTASENQFASVTLNAEGAYFSFSLPANQEGSKIKVIRLGRDGSASQGLRYPSAPLSVIFLHTLQALSVDEDPSTPGSAWETIDMNSLSGDSFVAVGDARERSLVGAVVNPGHDRLWVYFKVVDDVAASAAPETPEDSDGVAFVLADTKGNPISVQRHIMSGDPGGKSVGPGLSRAYPLPGGKGLAYVMEIPVPEEYRATWSNSVGSDLKANMLQVDLDVPGGTSATAPVRKAWGGRSQTLERGDISLAFSGGGSMSEERAWQEKAHWESPSTFLAGLAASLTGWLISGGGAASPGAFVLSALGWAAMPILFDAGHRKWSWGGRVLWKGNPGALRGRDLPRLITAKWALALIGFSLALLGLSPLAAARAMALPMVALTLWHWKLQRDHLRRLDVGETVRQAGLEALSEGTSAVAARIRENLAARGLRLGVDDMLPLAQALAEPRAAEDAPALDVFLSATSAPAGAGNIFVLSSTAEVPWGLLGPRDIVITNNPWVKAAALLNGRWSRVVVAPFAPVEETGLSELDVVELRRRDSRFAKLLAGLPSYRFFRSSTVGLTAAPSSDPEEEKLRWAALEAFILTALLRVAPASSVDWRKVRDVMLAIARAA